MLQTYRARDRRYYNGCPCSDLKREFDHTEKLIKKMKELNSSVHCIYFPAEGKYMTFIKYKILTNNFHTDKQEALIEAINILEGRKNNLSIE